MEKKIIGSLLTENKNIKYCYPRLTPEMFNNPLCKEAYTKFVQAYNLGMTVTVIDLAGMLEGFENLSVNEVAKFLGECVVEAPITSKELRSCVEYVICLFKGVEIQNLYKSLSLLPKDVNEAIRTLNRRTEELMKDVKPRCSQMSEISRKYETYYGREHEMGIRTGFYELDEILNGLNKGDVTVLGARPAVGKSALATQILTNVTEKGKKVAYFNLEMTDQQILERIITRYSGINLVRLRRAEKFHDDEELKYCQAMEKIRELNGLYVFSGSFSAAEIKMLCKNQEFDLVVIDYLQLVKPDKSYGNRVAEVGDVSKQIKALAMEMKVPVLALSQLNRKKSATDEPEIADLRESGDIEQDASQVLLMWNMSEDGKTKGVKVEKNRQGTLGKVAFSYEGDKMSFRTINYKSFSQLESELARKSTDSSTASWVRKDVE